MSRAEGNADKGYIIKSESIYPCYPLFHFQYLGKVSYLLLTAPYSL